MAVTLKAQTVTEQGGGSLPSSFTLPQSYSTATGDCIVVGICTQNNITVTGSGAGATWQAFKVTESVSGCTLTMLVGYGCTSGNTSVTLSGISGSGFYDAAVSVWGGMQTATSPVTASLTGSQAASSSPFTLGSVPYGNGQIVIGCSGVSSGSHAWSASFWGNSATNTNLWNAQTDRPITMDYIAVLSAGASVSYQADFNMAPAVAQVSIELTMGLPLSGGNMLLVL